jgi:hypothetical protein
MSVCPTCGRALPDQDVPFDTLLDLSTSWSAEEKHDWHRYLSNREAKYNDLRRAEQDMLKILTAKLEIERRRKEASD